MATYEGGKPRISAGRGPLRWMGYPSQSVAKCPEWEDSGTVALKRLGCKVDVAVDHPTPDTGAMIALALLLQAAPVPPVPSPPQDSYLAAIALWRDNAPSDAEIRLAVDSAVGAVASGALAEVGIQVDYRKQSSVGRWLKWYDLMKPMIARHVPTDLRQTNAVVADCVIEDLAWTLSPEEITRVRNFFSTAASKNFWSVAGVFHEKMKDCYLSALNLKAADVDYRTIGLRPPKPPKQRLPHGFVMN